MLNRAPIRNHVRNVRVSSYPRQKAVQLPRNIGGLQSSIAGQPARSASGLTWGVQYLFPARSASVAEEAQQHQEQVDEVEIEPQRTHHRFAAGDGAVVIGL